MIIAAFVSFITFWFLLKHIPPSIMRKMVGRLWTIDVPLHVGILWMFMGTSYEGLIQAEAAGIMFSIYLRWWRWAWGYEIDGVKFDGRFTRYAS